MSTLSQPARSAAAVRRRPLRRTAWIVVALGILATASWVWREPLLRGAADHWVVSDAITRADAVAIFGGGAEVRAFVAADLYKKGLVRKIVISETWEDASVAIGANPSHSEYNRTVLVKLGVPESAMETFGTANRSTRDEAVTLREWADRNKVSAIIVPTEMFSARRVRWMLHRAFGSTDVRIEVPSYESARFKHDQWWKTEEGIVVFQNEILKYIYYRVKY
jgi:uncharacterized SAM-binding protein YcdF (DUF218 family)